MKKTSLNTEWRKVAATIYSKPVDSKIYGSVEIDVTDLEAWVSRKRKEGLKITLTHIFVLILARALKYEVPELNTYIRRGNVVEREHVDAMVSVLNEQKEMSSVKVRSAENLTLTELADRINEEIKDSRAGRENKTMRLKGFLANIPWPFRVWIFKFIRMFTINWGISIPGLGLSAESFGSFVISNIGSIGLDMGYPALFPTSNVAIVFVMGGVSKKPVVIDDQVVIRRIMSFGATLDHRVVDANHGGKLFRFIKQIVNNPGLLDEKPVV
ncbi:MAG: 2-oxo acid dehydrogenase subunit E2 [Bacteroidales bacterium]|nr:2-oxo acid dehydrogenase subunit E2 [Bacteroidales bacterium]